MFLITYLMKAKYDIKSFIYETEDKCNIFNLWRN